MKIKSKGRVIGFADGTAIFYQVDTWQELRSNAEGVLNRLKPKYIPFSCNISNISSFNYISINILGNTYKIKSATESKYLRPITDRHLRWDKDISYVVRKLQSVLYKFKHLCKFLDDMYLKTIYYSLVESHLNWGLLAWGAAQKTHLKPLEVIQKRFLIGMLTTDNTFLSDLLFSITKLFDK